MLAKLIKPSGDKNYSFQVIGVTKDIADEIKVSFHNPNVKKAKPFIQGNSGDWIMVEFWTRNYNDILIAVKIISELINLPYSIGTDFTREEIATHMK